MIGSKFFKNSVPIPHQAKVIFMIYSHLSNKRGGWNKRGGGAKNGKSLNVEGVININF